MLFPATSPAAPFFSQAVGFWSAASSFIDKLSAILLFFLGIIIANQSQIHSRISRNFREQSEREVGEDPAYIPKQIW